MEHSKRSKMHKRHSVPGATKGRLRGAKNIPPSTNVFFNYLPPDFTEANLEQLCSPYGTISSSKIIIDLHTGQSKCFGFVDFATVDEANAAIAALDGLRINKKRLLVKYAVSKVEQKSSPPPSHEENEYTWVKSASIPMYDAEMLDEFDRQMTPDYFTEWESSDDQLDLSSTDISTGCYKDLMFAITAEVL